MNVNTSTTTTSAATVAEKLNADDRKLVAAALSGTIEPAALRGRDEAARRRIVRALAARFGEFARAVDDLRALAKTDDEREHIERRIANVLGCLRVVAPADAATGRPAGVLGDGRFTVSIEARAEAARVRRRIAACEAEVRRRRVAAGKKEF